MTALSQMDDAETVTLTVAQIKTMVQEGFDRAKPEFVAELMRITEEEMQGMSNGSLEAAAQMVETMNGRSVQDIARAIRNMKSNPLNEGST